MRNTLMIIIIILLLSSIATAENPAPTPRAEYLEFARAAAGWVWTHYDSLEEAWREKFNPYTIWGYRPPSRFLEMAAIYAELYKLESNQEYARRAEKVLLTYGGYRREFPPDAAALRPDYTQGVPALPDFFTAMRYIRAYCVLKESGLLSKSQRKKIEETIAHSIDYTLQSQEWGAMNRAALRAEVLAWAVKALPDHPRAPNWRAYERALAFDNWGNWEIEDASLYNAIWLYSLLGYAEVKERMRELFRTPEMYYYAQYYLYLMCPDGMIPDFGDSVWRANWDRFLAFFEAAAAHYRDARLKWAAAVIADKFIDFSQVRRTGLAYILFDCYNWAADDIIPQAPEELSMEVMEDVQGKKIVFRNGWDSEATYMLLNYRDEGDGGLLFRDYLRDGIPVEEEKMTHGHSDENSIALLMHKGSVLLHDGGYRDYMPSGPYGAYRADYFHNRLCVRPEKIWFGQKEGEYRLDTKEHSAVPGQPVLEFMRNAGSYRQVRTQKVDFLTFEEFDYSRTRLLDDKMGYQWDRVIVYIKNPEMFVVFDILKAVREGYLTAANLWHTRKITAQGDHWYDTQYDSLRNIGLDTDNSLLIYFPQTHYRFESVEPERRYYQDEYAICQYTAQHFELGQHIGFITVLIPHPADENPSRWLDRISVLETQPLDAGLALTIECSGKIIKVGLKSDLRMDIVRDYRRPKYTYESGRIVYGGLETNADFYFTVRTGKRLKFTVVNVSKAVYNGQVIFEQAPSLFGLAFDGSSDQYGVGKARYWRDELELK